MLRRLLLAAGLVCAALPAYAVCSLPVTLVNGTTADAGQVMADFNALLTCINNAAGTAIIGPASSAVNDLPDFGNTSGTLLKDSGVPLGAIAKGRVVFYPATNQVIGATTPWLYVTPDNSTINCIGTQTACLQETLSAAATNGWSVDVYGPGEKSNATNAIFIPLNAGLSFPPMGQRYVRFHSVNLTCTTTVVGPCVTIDSMAIAEISAMGGQWVYQPAGPGASSYAVYLNPQTAVPVEGTVGINASRIMLPNLAVAATGGTAVATVAVNAGASVVNNIITSPEINGAGSGVSTTNYCFYVISPGATTGFSENLIDLADVHQCKVAGVQIGVSVTNQANLGRNLWRIGGLKPGVATAVGLSTYGSGDIFDIGALTNEEVPAAGSLATGITFQSGAANNQVRATTSGVTTATVDSGSNNKSILNGYLTSGTPTALTCGAGASIGANASNLSGTLTVGGAGAQTTCALVFSPTLGRLPTSCVATFNQTGTVLALSALATTGFTFTASAGMPAASQIFYQCQ